MRFLRGFIISLMLLPLQLAAAELKPFVAHYKAELGSITADATRQLSLDENNQWQLSQEAKNLFASVSESSQFHFQSQKLISQRYEYLRKVFGSTREALLVFDWENNSVSNDVQGKPWSYDIQKGTLDKLNYQLQLRLDLQQQPQGILEYPIADGGVLKHYRFKVVGEEQLETDLGPLQAIKVQRIYGSNSSKQATFWFAKDLNYLLIKYLLINDKGNKSQLAITQLEDAPA